MTVGILFSRVHGGIEHSIWPPERAHKNVNGLLVSQNDETFRTISLKMLFDVLTSTSKQTEANYRRMSQLAYVSV